MAGGEEKTRDYYQVLGLKKECSASELRDAYKKLAMRWHPDRCSSSGNSKGVEEAKKTFQTIQQAYSVLSDTNKRFMYDVGIYDTDDDDNSGMTDFLNEMAVMMSQTQTNENGDETLEQLQDLFHDMFPDDVDTFAATSSSYVSYGPGSNHGSSSGFSGGQFPSFCLGAGDGVGLRPKEVKNGRRNGSQRHRPRRQKDDEETLIRHFPDHL